MTALKPGSAILVQSGFVTDAGEFVSATGTSVVVKTRTGQVTIAKDEIDDVQVLRARGDRVRAGLLWGGVMAGATAGMMFPLTARLTNPHYLPAGIMTAANGTSIGLSRYRYLKTKRIYRRK